MGNFLKNQGTFAKLGYFSSIFKKGEGKPPPPPFALIAYLLFDNVLVIIFPISSQT